MGPLALNAQHSPPPSSEAPSPTSTRGPGLEGSPTRAVEWNKAPASLWGWGLLDPGAAQIQVQTQALPVTSCVTQEATGGFQASVFSSGPWDDTCPVGCGLEAVCGYQQWQDQSGLPLGAV